MLRGSANSVVRAVVVSMLAIIIVSVRAPVRSGPASLPTSRTFSRGLLIASATVVPPPPTNRLFSSVRWELTRLRREPERRRDEQTQRRDDDHADDAAARVETAGPGERVGAHDLGDPGQARDDKPDHHDDQDAAGQQVLDE